MSIRDSFNQPRIMIRLGCVLLILASLSMRFLHPSARLSEDVLDGVNGLLYGLAISCMLLGVRLNVRRRSGTPAGPCS